MSGTEISVLRLESLPINVPDIVITARTEMIACVMNVSPLGGDYDCIRLDK